MRNLLILSLVAFLPACTALDMERVRRDAIDGSACGGMVVNHSQPHSMLAVFPTNPGSTDLTVEPRAGSLPSMTELYVVGYDGAVFSNRTLEVDLNPDSTIKRLKITSEVTLDDALNGIAASTGELTDEIVKYREQKKQEKEEKRSQLKELAQPPPDPLEVENATLQRELLNLMLKANKEAVEEGGEPPYELE